MSGKVGYFFAIPVPFSLFDDYRMMWKNSIGKRRPSSIFE